jgi:hypothetical protein
MFTRISRLCLWLAVSLVAACGTEKADTTIKIVGGQVSNDSQSPVVTFTLAGGSVAGSSFSRSCTATRIGDREFLTAASCLDRFYSANAKLALMLTGDGKMLSKLEIEGIRFHPKYDAVAGENSFYNVASFTLKSTTPDLETSVGTAVLEKGTKPQPGSAIRIYGGGCESVKDDGSCGSASSWTKKAIKVLETKVMENSEVTGTQAEGFFFSDKSDGFIAGEDLGGPVFQPVGQKMWRLVGVNAFPRLLFQKVPAYIWIGHADVFDFVKNTGSGNSGSDTALAAEIASTIKQIDEELAKCSENQTPAVAMTRANPASSSFSTPFARTVSSNPCPQEPAAREARIRALYLAKSYALAAQEALKQGKTEEAKDLLERSKEMLGYALMITEFIVDFTPLGRVKDAAECLTGYKAFPELEEGAEGETTKVFKMQKLEPIDQVFSCVGALGLDERLLKFVGGYLSKFEVFQRAAGYMEDIMGRILAPADALLKKLDAKYQKLKSAVFRERLSDSLAKVRRGLGANASQADVEEFMDVAAKLDLSEPHQLENLASFLGQPTEVKKLRAVVDGLTAEQAELLGIAKGRIPGLNTEDTVDLIKSLESSGICIVVGLEAKRSIPGRVLDFLFPTAYAAKVDNSCFKKRFDDFVKAYALNQHWNFKQFAHVLFGDFVEENGKVMLKGGMHTAFALDRFIQLNSAKGVHLKIVDVEFIPTTNNSVDTIYRKILPNGITRVQPPHSFMKQPISVVDETTGLQSTGIKTLFPDTMSPEDVAKLGNQLPTFANTEKMRIVEATLNDVTYTLQIVVDPATKKTITFYPNWNQL